MAKLPRKTTVKAAIRAFFGCKKGEILRLTRKDQGELAREVAAAEGWVLKDADEYPVADPA
jgi:hypothetical protein